MKKNLKTIKEFIENSIGEWKSIRSTHTLAFQEFENTNSNLSISYLEINSREILAIKKEFKYSNNPSLAIQISCASTSEWSLEKDPEVHQTVLVFFPEDDFSGTILKNKGYAELIPTFSHYFIDKLDNLNIISNYNMSISEEKIWFLSENVRSRYSVVKSKANNAILQTSHASEIRKMTT